MPEASVPIDQEKLRKKLRVVLVQHDLAQWELASKLLDLSPSAFNDYLVGRRPMPPDFVVRIERALGLAEGELSAE